MSPGKAREDSHRSLMNDVGTFFMLNCCTTRGDAEHRVTLVKKNHLASPTFSDIMRKKLASTTILPIRLPENGDVSKQLAEMVKRQKKLRKLLEGQEVRFEDAIKCFNSSKVKTKRLDVSLSTEVSSSKLGKTVDMYLKEQKLQAHLAQEIKTQRLQIEKIKQDIKRVNMEHLSLRDNLKDEVAVFKSPDSNSRRPPLARTLSGTTPSSA